MTKIKIDPVGYIYGKPIYCPTLEDMCNIAFRVKESTNLSRTQKEILQNHGDYFMSKIPHTLESLKPKRKILGISFYK